MPAEELVVINEKEYIAETISSVASVVEIYSTQPVRRLAVASEIPEILPVIHCYPLSNLDALSIDYM